MYRTLLLPLDGSPLAERALPYATALARASGARVVAVQARLRDHEEHVERVNPATGEVYTVDLAAMYLQDVQARLAATGISAETCLVEGEPAEAIVRASGEQQADVIVMATHGRSGFGRWLYGSVADAVLRMTHLPVLLVPAAATFAWPAKGGGVPDAIPCRILVPLDGSELAHEALPVASEFARNLAAEIILLRVVTMPVYPYGEAYAYLPYDPTADLEDARTWIEGVAATLRDQGHAVDALVEAGMPAPMIAEVARERQVSAIVMATHGRSGLARVVLGSVATGTLHLAQRPVLLVRPLAMRPQVALQQAAVSEPSPTPEPEPAR